MRHIFVALILAIGASACGDEPECFDIDDKEVEYGSPRGFLNIESYFHFDEGKKIQVAAPVRIDASDHCMVGTTNINSYLSPGFKKVDCLDITDEKELNRITNETGIVPGFLSPQDENLVREINLENHGSSAARCYYNVQ